MNTFHFRLAGYATLELIDARSQVVKKTWRCKNLITNAALNAIGHGTPITDLIQFAAAGTSATAPAAGQTTLVAEILPSATHRTDDDGGIADTFGIEATYTWRRWYRTWSAAQAVGTLQEIGLFSAAAGGTMWSRFLTTDALGVTDFVIKTVDDELRLTYELRVYPPVADSDVDIEINGVTTTVAGRACNFAANTAWGSDGVFFEQFGLSMVQPHQAYETNALVAIAADPGAGVAASSSLVLPYANDSFSRDVRARWDSDVANFALGVGRAAFILHPGTALPMFQFTFDPRIAKEDSQSLLVTCRVSWGG